MPLHFLFFIFFIPPQYISIFTNNFMKHIALFEGIGGFSLAARWMGWNTVAWVEIDLSCQKVLKKNFPKSIGYGDIRKFDGNAYKGKIDILTGGFPCQPFSKAGNGSGELHSSYLWHEMYRVIREIEPPFIVGENVANIEHLGIEKMLADLENSGYKVELYNIPAIAIGCSHQRERLWIVAHNDTFRLQNVQQSRISEIPKIQKNKCIQVEELFRVEGDKGWVYQPRICGVIDGIPSELDKNRLKQIGNAIVPQIAYQIFQAL
jgi:DNA (cytosine-5)-methyltransferase 1